VAGLVSGCPSAKVSMRIGGAARQQGNAQNDRRAEDDQPMCWAPTMPTGQCGSHRGAGLAISKGRSYATLPSRNEMAAAPARRPWSSSRYGVEVLESEAT